MRSQISDEITFRKLEILLAYMEGGNLPRQASSTSARSACTAPCIRWKRAPAANCSS